MNTTEVHRRLRHTELRIVEFTLPQQAQTAQLADGIVHRFECTVPQTRIRRMAALSEDIDALHHDALVHANRLEPGRLADHRRTAQRLAGLGQGAGTGHRTFFITGGENQQRLLERLIEQRLHGLDDQREKALHVATAQPDPAAVNFGELQRIGLPQRIVIRHGIAVPGQDQAAGAAAESGEQVEFAGADLLDVATEAQITQPAGEQIDHRPVGLIQAGWVQLTDGAAISAANWSCIDGKGIADSNSDLKSIIEPSGARNKPPQGVGSLSPVHCTALAATHSPAALPILDFPAMQKETEIKLRVSRETLAALREHPLLKKRNKNGWERRELMNQYFDTPERDLAKAKVALRLRKDGDEVIQTLKTRGQSVAGLSERNEYDWKLPKAKLDVKKLDGECWPESLAELDKKTLKPIFTTDFVRERAEIAWAAARPKWSSKLRWTSVMWWSANRRRNLRAGTGTARRRAGRTAGTGRRAGRNPGPDAVRHQQGRARLPSVRRQQLLAEPAGAATDPETPLDDAFAALAWHLLGSSQRLADRYRFNGHWRLLQDWVENLAEMRALLSSLGQAAPRSATHDLRVALDALLEDWRPLVQVGIEDEDVRKAAPEQFLEELEDPRWACSR